MEIRLVLVDTLETPARCRSDTDCKSWLYHYSSGFLDTLSISKKAFSIHCCSLFLKPMCSGVLSSTWLQHAVKVRL